MSKNLSERPTYTYTADDWNQLRAHFMGSILVDIHLHKLAQNIGAAWSAKGKDETPAKYLEFSFEELTAAPGLAGHPARRQLLLDILKETASFDDPFQDMIDSTADSARSSGHSDHLLHKLGVPSEFPLAFTALSSETKDLCRDEGAVTIGQCVALFQKMAQELILGGEVRQLLNCLAQADEHGLTAFLPLRVGSHGLHLAEAIALLIGNLPKAERISYIVATRAIEETLPSIEDKLMRQLPQLLEWFPEEEGTLRKVVMKNEAVDRFFHSLNDPSLEVAATKLATRYFTPPPSVVAEPKPACLMQRVSGFFRANR